MIQSSQSLAEVALQFPSASRIFRHHRLDFCCGGQRSIADACTARGVDPVAIIRDIETSGPAPKDTDWQTRSLTDLIDHILVNYHEAHRRELPDLIDLARKVERVHSDKANVPAGISAHLLAMQESLELHMQKEERILFPAIGCGQGRHLLAPTQQMQIEHEEHAENLRYLRKLASNFVPPAEACTSWRALLLRCEQLEGDIMDHVHLENHVLFPRALRGDH